MTFKPRVWEPIAWILAGINVAAVYFAALPGETWHATAHAVLAVAFALWARRLRRLRTEPMPDGSTAERLAEIEARVAEFDQLPNVETRLAELEERLDFTERALIEVRGRAQLPPKG
ncbi:MAG TPA: hypothetical protein VK573_09685 [Gemmatimonadales bacterium]|nr:hypothetical protein [Gemmatimonadales bacterium]